MVSSILFRLFLLFPFPGLLTVAVVPPSDFSNRSLSFLSISLMTLSLGRVAGGGPPEARPMVAVPEPGGKTGTTFDARPKVIVRRPEVFASFDSVSVDCQM